MDSHISGHEQEEMTSANSSDSPNAPTRERTYQTEEIQDWLITRLSNQLGLDLSDIGINEAFAGFGVDSVQAISISGDWTATAAHATVGLPHHPNPIPTSSLSRGHRRVNRRIQRKRRSAKRAHCHHRPWMPIPRCQQSQRVLEALVRWCGCHYRGPC